MITDKHGTRIRLTLSSIDGAPQSFPIFTIGDEPIVKNLNIGSIPVLLTISVFRSLPQQTLASPLAQLPYTIPAGLSSVNEFSLDIANIQTPLIPIIIVEQYGRPVRVKIQVGVMCETVLVVEKKDGPVNKEINVPIGPPGLFGMPGQSKKVLLSVTWQ